MTISFDSLVIIIVVVSASIVIGVIVALCWMWKILRHDRHCVTLQNPYSWTVVPPWPTETCTPTAETAVEIPGETAPLTNETTTARILPTRRENSNRTASAPPWEEVISRHIPGAEVIVIDGTEPPPPYAFQ